MQHWKRQVNHRKRTVARVFDALGLSRLGLLLQRVRGGPYIRAVNYHDLSPDDAGRFEDQLRYFQRNFEPIGRTALEDFLAGRLRLRRPGLALTFDDGLKSHAEIAAPLLEEYGFEGWFAVPAQFPGLEHDPKTFDHDAFRARHQVNYHPAGAQRPVLDWHDVRRLDAAGHVICCHSFSHCRLAASLTPDDLEREIHRAKKVLEEGLGHEVDVFVWVGGEEWAYSAAAARAIRDAGFRYGFMTNNLPIRCDANPLQLQRTHVEATDPPEVVRLSLSGALDLLYTPKRRRVNRTTAVRAW